MHASMHACNCRKQRLLPTTLLQCHPWPHTGAATAAKAVNVQLPPRPHLRQCRGRGPGLPGNQAHRCAQSQTWLSPSDLCSGTCPGTGGAGRPAQQGRGDLCLSLMCGCGVCVGCVGWRGGQGANGGAAKAHSSRGSEQRERQRPAGGSRLYVHAAPRRIDWSAWRLTEKQCDSHTAQHVTVYRSRLLKWADAHQLTQHHSGSTWHR